jgi:hypothetical protein
MRDLRYVPGARPHGGTPQWRTVQKCNRISVLIQDVIMREMGPKKGRGGPAERQGDTPPRPCQPSFM